MYKAIYAVGGLIVGAIAGYIFAKKKFEKELQAKTEAMERTYKAMRERDLKKAEDEKAEAVENAKVETVQEIREATATVDVIHLAEEEERELREFWEMIGDDPSYNESWETYFKSIEDYLVPTAAAVPPYNITEEMFANITNHYNKVHIIVDKTSEFESARNADTGEEIFDFHDSLGDIEHDTFNPERKIGGYWYIRNPYEDTDYCVEVLTMADLVH